MQLKLQKYGNAGVREYWMIDPGKKCIVTYDLENLGLPVVYKSQDSVPVGIWGGECVIDFAQIFSFLDFLYEQ